MTILVLCDRCGRTGSWDTMEEVSIESSSDHSFPEGRRVSRHFCKDYDGREEGCYRKVWNSLSATMKHKSPRSL